MFILSEVIYEFSPPAGNTSPSPGKSPGDIPYAYSRRGDIYRQETRQEADIALPGGQNLGRKD